MSKNIPLRALEIIIYAGIFIAFIVPIFKPAEPQEPSNNSQSFLIHTNR